MGSGKQNKNGLGELSCFDFQHAVFSVAGRLQEGDRVAGRFLRPAAGAARGAARAPAKAGPGL